MQSSEVLCGGTVGMFWDVCDAKTSMVLWQTPQLPCIDPLMYPPPSM